MEWGKYVRGSGVVVASEALCHSTDGSGFWLVVSRIKAQVGVIDSFHRIEFWNCDLPEYRSAQAIRPDSSENTEDKEASDRGPEILRN